MALLMHRGAMSRLAVSSIIVCIAIVVPSASEARCDPCAKANQVRWSKGVVGGMARVPKARRTELRQTILRDFRRRARRLGGRLMSTAGTRRGRSYHSRRVRRFGQTRIGGTQVEVVIASIEIEAKSDHPDLEKRISEDKDGFGRDELWVFWGKKGKPPIKTRIGAPGGSGTSGNAFMFSCGKQELCALVWENGQGAPYTGNPRILRIRSKGEVQIVGRLNKKIARLLEGSADAVHPGRCGTSTLVCFKAKGKTAAADPQDYFARDRTKVRLFRRALTVKGFELLR